VSIRNTSSGGVGVGHTVLFCHVKNEAPFILEWIAYHIAIGFDEIVICSNPSTDGTEEILEVLSKSGRIRHIRATVEMRQSAHEASVTEFNRSVGYVPGHWYIWLDADEFLNVHVGSGLVSDLLAALGEYSGILVNWRIFGTSGNAYFPGRFIDSAFIKAAAKERAANLEIKTLFRFGDDFQGFSQKYSHRPLVKKVNLLKPESFLTGCGDPALSTSSRNIEWLSGVGSRAFHFVEEAEFGWKLAQVNHYAVRTPEMFKLKRARGRASVPLGSIQNKQRYREKYLKYYDKNDVEDTTILRWKEKTASVIDELLRLPKMQEAVQNAALRTRAELAALGVMPGECDSVSVTPTSPLS
jgi:glycosyltransferase involved in cell wall biosynthesis